MVINKRFAWLAGLAAAALFATTGCGGIECAEGTTENDGECVIAANGCGEGTQLVDGACVPASDTCEAGTQFDEEAGRCVPAEGSCSDGTTYDMATGLCVADTEVVCGEGTAADDTNICVPSDDACGPMTSLDDDGRCIVQGEVCGDGSELDPNENTCVLVDEACGQGLALDTDSMTCVPTADVCQQPGTAFDEESGLCLPDACDEGDVLVNGVCLSPAEELAQNADVTETENNDPALGGTAESLTIPAIGADATSFTGTIGEATDLDGDSTADQDVDVYSFSGTAGQWLNVGVQTTGAPAPGFRIEGPNGFERWSAIGLQANPARQVVLPYDGDYTITVLPQLILDDSGIGPIGGDDWGYVGTVEQIDVPSATSVDFTSANASGSLPQLTDNFFEATGFSGGELVDMVAESIGDNGVAVVSFWGGPTDFLGSTEVATADEFQTIVPASGTLFVLVDWKVATGPELGFELSGSINADSESLGSIGADATASSTAVDLADEDTYTYTFSVPAGQVIEIYHENTEEEEIDITLRDSAGNELLTDSFVDVPSDFSPDYNYWYSANGGTFLLEIEATTDLTAEVVTVQTHTPNDLGNVAVGDTVNQTVTTPLNEDRSQFHLINATEALQLDGSVTSTPADTVDGWIYDTNNVELEALTSGDPLDLTGTIIPQGQHLIRIEATGADFTEYVVDFTTVQPPQMEMEPNDTEGNATPVTTDRDVLATLGETDTDVYSFSPATDLGADEILIARVEQDGSGFSDDYLCQLRDSSGNVLYGNGPDGRAEGCVMFGTGLSASETYYLSIERLDGTSDEDYAVSFRRVSGVLETEPNEDDTEATSFTYSDLTAGSFALYGDVQIDTDTDTFSFTLASDRPTDEIVSFALNRLHPNSTSTMDWRLLDGSLNEIAAGDYDEALETGALTAGTYYVEVTRTSSTVSYGAVYEITASTRTAVCGDGVVEGGETCDDGNTTDGDGCSSMCMIEAPDVTLSASPNVAIPADGTILTETLTASGCATVSSVNVDVDITHPYRGDLAISLEGPSGTTVELAASAFDGTDDYIGNFPRDFTPSGSLGDFAGETGNGTWSLIIEDTFPSSDDGDLNSWGVNIYCQ